MILLRWKQVILSKIISCVSISFTKIKKKKIISNNSTNQHETLAKYLKYYKKRQNQFLTQIDYFEKLPFAKAFMNVYKNQHHPKSLTVFSI
jgi:hypothetical protein